MKHAIRSALAAALCALLLSPLAARAQEAGKLLAVQQRKFRLDHELVIGGMFEPEDAFSKGLALEGAYVWHLDDTWSWEVLRGGYLARLNTSLRSQLENQFGVAPTAFESLQYYASTAMTFAPLYGKFALRNSSLVHAEAFVTFGAALGRFSSGSYQPAPELGLGARVFLSQRMSVRFDARDAVFLSTKKPGEKFVHTENTIFLSLGLAISLGGTDG